MKSLTVLSSIAGGNNFQAPVVTVYNPGPVMDTGIEGDVEYKRKNLFGDLEINVSGMNFEVAPAHRDWGTCFMMFGAGAGAGMITAPFVIAAVGLYAMATAGRGL